jgi:Mrp family chromosome partitioning ATPase
VLADRGELVVFDCPPLSVGADASVIAERVDGVIVVVDLMSSTEQGVRRALQQLDAVKAPVLGIVINRDRSATPSAYDYYSSLPASSDLPKGRGERKRARRVPAAR